MSDPTIYLVAVWLALNATPKTKFAFTDGYTLPTDAEYLERSSNGSHPYASLKSMNILNFYVSTVYPNKQVDLENFILGSVLIAGPTPYGSKAIVIIPLSFPEVDWLKAAGEKVSSTYAFLTMYRVYKPLHIALSPFVTAPMV